MNQTMRYRAANNQELVEYLKRKGVIKSQRIFDVMSKVDRKKYVNNHNPYNEAYIDSPQNIGNGRTISAPHMHAVVLETLDSKLCNGCKVLAIRCSAGYLATCMASLVGPKGRVVHVESNPDVQFKVKANIINDDPSLLTNNRIKLVLNDELNGYSSEGPYDVIYIGAAVSEIPQKIIDQLAIDGRLLLPMIESKDDVDSQMLTLVKKNIFSDKGFTKEALIPVRYGILNRSPIKEQVNNSDNKGVPYTPKASTLQVPKILETPVPISSFSGKSISETNISDDKCLQTPTKIVNIENGILSRPSFSFNNISKTKISDNTHLPETPKTINLENSTLPVPKILETPVSISSFCFNNNNNTETKISDNKQNLPETCSTLSVPKILETPVSISSIRDNNISESNVNSEKLNGNCQKNEIELVNSQDTDIAKIKDNFDGLEKKLSELEDAFRKTLKTSSILKQTNQNKLYAIEKKYSHLDSEINAAKNSFEQKMTEQHALVKNISKQLELNLFKLNRRLTNRSVIMEKNSTILERKLNKKIAKLKRILEDKINDEGRLLVKELSVFKVSIEDKLAKENAVFYQKISGELKKRDFILLTKIKEEFLRLSDAEKIDSEGKGEKTVQSSNEQKSSNTQLGFCAIITLHTLLAVRKIFF